MIKLHVYSSETDAEKALDRVSWQFMFEMVKHIGIGQKTFN